MSAFTSRLTEVCLNEFERWDKGEGREIWGRPQYSKDFYLFVKDYWVSIGNNNLTGRTVNSQGIRPAWSSAFVSFCVRSAGAGNKFRYAEAHCHYIDRGMKAANGSDPNGAYVARLTTDRKPVEGDIVCAGREYAKSYNYESAALIYEADSFYPSHGDIVVQVDDQFAYTIGGNINNNVSKKRLKLTDMGYLKNRVGSNGAELPWICILECVI